MKTLALLTCLLLSTSLMASFTKGNGGNILDCSHKQNVVLDYYEINPLHSFTSIKDIGDKEIFMSFIDKRLALISPTWQAKFNFIVNDLAARIKFVQAPLGTVNDAYVVIIPNDCELKQTAVQINNRIIINEALFNSLNDFQQNIFLAHEIIYSIMLSERSLDDSRPVRALVALLLNQNFDKMSAKDIHTFMMSNNIQLP